MSQFQKKYYPDVKRPNLIARNLNKDGYFKLTAYLASKSIRHFEKIFGLHVTPSHYYSPIPSTKDLDSKLFAKKYSLKGLNIDTDAQFNHLKNNLLKYAAEFEPLPNSGLSLVDAFLLYAQIRSHKPKKMIEVGAGDTTYISLDALAKNLEEGFPCDFTTIEPYPRRDITQIRHPLFKHEHKKLQDLPFSFFEDVDLLFIDSSHVSKIGSDVNFEVLEIFPILKKGALVHLHDIPFPQNYWEDWTRSGNMFWNESYLLHAFLLFNESFSIQWASNYLYLNHFSQLKELLPYLRPEHRLSSFWIKRDK